MKTARYSSSRVEGSDYERVPATPVPGGLIVGRVPATEADARGRSWSECRRARARALSFSAVHVEMADILTTCTSNGRTAPR